MKKIASAPPADQTAHRRIRFTTVAALVAALLVLCSAAYAVAQWTGFQYTSQLSQREIDELLEAASSTSFYSEDSQGNITFYDDEGNVSLELTAEEYQALEEARAQDRLEENQAAAGDFLDVTTLDSQPGSITTVPVAEDGSFADFMLGGGNMVILYPEGQAGYTLQAGDTVTISLEADSVCYLSYGLVQDGVWEEIGILHADQQTQTFTVPADGTYCFTVEYYSVSAGILSNGSVTITAQ